MILTGKDGHLTEQDYQNIVRMHHELQENHGDTCCDDRGKPGTYQDLIDILMDSITEYLDNTNK